MPVDWNKPMVTNLGEPAEVVNGPDEDGDYLVRGVFDHREGINWWWFRPDGTAIGDAPYSIHNAEPGDPSFAAMQAALADLERRAAAMRAAIAAYQEAVK